MTNAMLMNVIPILVYCSDRGYMQRSTFEASLYGSFIVNTVEQHVKVSKDFTRPRVSLLVS